MIRWLSLLSLVLGGCASYYGLPVVRQPGPALNGEESPSAQGALLIPVTRHTQGLSRDLHPCLVDDGGDWLYFASDRDGRGFDIYRQRLGYHAAQRLTHLDGDELWPRVSRDGRWLSFGGNARGWWDIYLLDLQAVGEPQLVTPDAREDCVQPTWSPDGSMLCHAAWSAALDDWCLCGISLSGQAGPEIPKSPLNGRPTEFVALEDRREREPVRGAPARPREHLRQVVSRWRLLSASGTPVAGLHPDFAPDGLRVAYQYARGGWFTVRVYDFSTGLTTTLNSPRGYGAIQPRFMADGRILFLTVNKAQTGLMSSGDGFAITDLAGQAFYDLRNPLGRGRVTDPMEYKGRIYFGGIDGSESLYSVAVR